MVSKDNNTAPLIFKFFCIATVLGCLIFSSCTGGSSGEDKTFEGSSKQKFIGTFVNSNGEPLIGVIVTILNSGDRSTTNESGVSEIETETALVGDVEIEVASSWGADSVLLSNLHQGVSRITYTVSVNQAKKKAVLRTRHLAPPGSDSVALDSMCTDCHEVLGDPYCGSRYWEDIHGDFFNCNQEGSSAGTNCTACHGDLGSPRCGDAKWETKHLGFFSCQHGVSCTTCHGDRGGPRCGDVEWRGFHDSVYNCSRRTCIACHGNRGSSPKCGDSEWVGDHTSVYSCGFGCTACHADRGAPRCGDGRWEDMHEGFFSCEGTLTCKTCHGETEVWPECSNRSWKDTHTFYSCQDDKQGETTNCKLCHTDSNFAAPLCGVDSWESLHNFYPCPDDGDDDDDDDDLSSCAACHSEPVQPDCGNASWESIHSSVWTCP